jgi:hypothetical protein
LTAALLIEQRAPEKFRLALWPIYEMLRTHTGETYTKAPLFAEFKTLASAAVAAYVEPEAS